MTSVWIVEEVDCEGAATLVGVFGTKERAEDGKATHVETEAARARTEHEEYLKHPRVTFVMHDPHWRPATADEVYERRHLRCSNATIVTEREVL